jgi:hypothetical protein
MEWIIDEGETGSEIASQPMTATKTDRALASSDPLVFTESISSLTAGKHTLKVIDTALGDGWGSSYWSLLRSDSGLFAGGPGHGVVGGPCDNGLGSAGTCQSLGNNRVSRIYEFTIYDLTAPEHGQELQAAPYYALDVDVTACPATWSIVPAMASPSDVDYPIPSGWSVDDTEITFVHSPGDEWYRYVINDGKADPAEREAVPEIKFHIKACITTDEGNQVCQTSAEEYEVSEIVDNCKSAQFALPTSELTVTWATDAPDLAEINIEQEIALDEPLTTELWPLTDPGLQCGSKLHIEF